MSNAQLFIACIAIWGSTWLAITFQLGEVPPEASVAYRFLLASLLVFAFCRARGMRLRFTLAEHAWLALFGMLMFCVQYILIYHAEQYVVSGLVAVGYSASPLLGMFGARLFFGTPMTGRVALGSILGVTGIALVFLPEVSGSSLGADPRLGAMFTVGGVLAAALASIVAHRNQTAGLPLWQTMAWAMFYGAMFALAVTVGSGKRLAFDFSFPYVLSLLYLAILGSIVTFSAYLTLLGRVGAARAGYVGVMVPIVALAISTAFEDFSWHVLTWVGIAISVLGNVVILREKREVSPTDQTAAEEA